MAESMILSPARETPGSDDVGLGSHSIDTYIHSLEVKWFKVILGMGIVLIPCFGLLDFVLVTPTELPLFWSMRALVTAVLGIQYLLIHKLKWEKHIEWQAYFFSLVAGGMISMMTTRLGGFESSYYAGLNMVILAVSIFIPWKASKAIINAAIVMGVYLTLNFITDQDYSVIFILTNILFMTGTIIISVTAGHLKFRQIRSEFGLKTESVELKNQQDGDYYLTAQFLNPLHKAESKSDVVVFDALLKQYKTVVFNGKNAELGGDIYICDSLRFLGRGYTLFVNGDAMGKSMQGAGGALVFGSLFHYLIDTSKNLASPKIGPEEWIKETVLSLNLIFARFDGCMLVSMVLGLIDEEAGFLYLVNAEHPFVVLYRDGRAEFIESDTVMPKLGSPELPDKFLIQTRQLRQGDILIAGSDGRDELVQEGVHGPETNFNPDAFLDVVTEGEGNIQEIYKGVKKRGSIRDDLSLVSLQFTGVPKPLRCAHRDRDVRIEPLLTHARRELGQGTWAGALSRLKEVLGIAPGHPEALYLSVKVSALSQDFQSLAYFSDQRALLYPEHQDSFVLGTFAHSKLKNHTPAPLKGPGPEAHHENSPDIKLPKPRKAKVFLSFSKKKTSARSKINKFSMMFGITLFNGLPIGADPNDF